MKKHLIVMALLFTGLAGNSMQAAASTVNIQLQVDRNPIETITLKQDTTPAQIVAEIQGLKGIEPTSWIYISQLGSPTPQTYPSSSKQDISLTDNSTISIFSTSTPSNADSPAPHRPRDRYGRQGFDPRYVQINPEAVAVGALTLAALTAAAGTYMTRRAYQNKKNQLVKKYGLGNLTHLQDKVWLATLSARFGVTRFLNGLVRSNPDASLTDFTGSNPRALAEFYFGKAPTDAQLNQFIKRFFPGR